MRRSSQRARLRHRAFVGLEVAAAVASIGVVAIGAVDRLTPDAGAPTLPERRQIVAFRQLANRICGRSTRDMRRAIAGARTRSERLGLLFRATDRSVVALSGVTAPPSKAAAFAADVWARRHVAGDLLDLQRAVETGDIVAQAEAEAELHGAEARAAALSRSLGLSSCAPVLPPLRDYPTD